MTSTIPQGFDPVAVTAWLRILHQGSPGHVSIVSTDDWAGRAFPTSDLAAAASYVAELHQAGREGIYLRITSLIQPPEPGRRAGADLSAALPALWADLDIAGPGHNLWCPPDCGTSHTHICPPDCATGHQHITRELPPDEAAGRAVIADSGLPEPTIWIHSGGGLYPVWLLTQPWILDAGSLDQAKTLARDWQRVIEHAAARHGWWYGRGVGDLSRVLRIPGTINRKAGLARPCRILGGTPTRYTVQELQAALDAAIARIAPPTPPAPPVSLLGAPGHVDRPAGHISPGDDYNQRTSWAEILTPAGWREHYRQDDVTYWTRPGKPSGTSASTNALGSDKLHVFTTSASPLEGGESYSKFGALAALVHGGDHSAAAKALGAAGYGTPLPNPADEHRQALAEILGGPVPDPPPPPPPPPGPWTARINVTNTAIAAAELRQQLGRGRLAGYFNRGDQIVHTPREGEDGYVPLRRVDTDDDGPAQIRPVTDSQLASRISFSYDCYRVVGEGEKEKDVAALFPKTAARPAVDAPDMMPHLRPLRGVVHAPILRVDGTVLAAPGYDPATALLHLPEPDLTVPPVPDQPTGQHVADAVALLDRMVDGFNFVSKHDRANYFGILLTPLLRAIAPPPYQLAAITAPQPGSGKTLLATVARIIHGGVFRAELPATDDELRKQITTILDYTTGPLVHFDNVAGTVRSSIIAGLLTSAKWDDRRLGTMEMVHARNDRLWILTGNNLSLGGDLTRRTLWVTIDPGVPNPHLRTGFAIADLERWARDNRAALIHALLTMARSWVAQGSPVAAPRSSDSYSRWIQVVTGILATAGVEGQFAAAESQQQEQGADDDDWADFLAAVHRLFDDQQWTVKELLGHVDTGNLLNPGAIPLEVLPTELAEKAGKPGVGVQGIAKSLGRWLRNRAGRWAGGLTVRQAGPKTASGVPWRIEREGPKR